MKFNKGNELTKSYIHKEAIGKHHRSANLMSEETLSYRDARKYLRKCIENLHFCHLLQKRYGWTGRPTDRPTDMDLLKRCEDASKKFDPTVVIASTFCVYTAATNPI